MPRFTHQSFSVFRDINAIIGHHEWTCFFSHNSPNGAKRKKPSTRATNKRWRGDGSLKNYEILILKLHTPKFHMEPEPLEKKDPLGKPVIFRFPILPIPSAAINKSFPNSPRRKPPVVWWNPSCLQSEPIVPNCYAHRNPRGSPNDESLEIDFFGSFLKEIIGEDEDVKMDVFQKKQEQGDGGFF